MLLTGIHLMRAGDAPAYLPELVAAKAEREHGAADLDHARVAGDVERLHVVLDEAQARSGLPEAPAAHDALHDFVVRVRLVG